MNIKEDPRIEQWLEGGDIAKSTRVTYLFFMEEFCDCIKKTPTELIEEANQETRSGKLLSERNTVIYITKFKKCLENKAPKTQALALSTIKSFYQSFDIQLSVSTRSKKKKLPLRENGTFLTKDDVKKLIVNADNLRFKAIMLCMATSGMARQEILNLKIKDITYERIGDNAEIGILNIRREKSQTDYTTFISPEAVTSIKNYFEERNRDPALKIKNNDDFVFVTYRHGKYKGRGEKITAQTFGKGFKKLGDELGYSNGKYQVKSHSHALRKFFASTLENAGMPKNKVDFMLGHTQNGSDRAYFNIDINKLKDIYIKYLPSITFEKNLEVRSLDTKDSKILDELKKENELMKKEHQELMSKIGMLEELSNSRNATMEELIERIIDRREDGDLLHDEYLENLERENDKRIEKVEKGLLEGRYIKNQTVDKYGKKIIEIIDNPEFKDKSEI